MIYGLTFMNEVQASRWLCRFIQSLPSTGREAGQVCHRVYQQHSGQSYKHMKTIQTTTNNNKPEEKQLLCTRTHQSRDGWMRNDPQRGNIHESLWIPSFPVTPNHKPHFPTMIRLHTSGRGRYVPRWRTPLIKAMCFLLCFSYIRDFTLCPPTSLG